MKPIFRNAFIIFIALFAMNHSLYSQTHSISGIITDSTGKNPLFGASVVLRIQGDTANKIIAGASTDSMGHFSIPNLNAGTYRMRAVCTGYKPSGRKVTINDSNVNVGKIMLLSSGTMLAGVDINDKQIRMSQNGDTTAYNAGAYKTNPDATAEDLVNKLPGTTNENGTLKINGEEVKQVLVDGKPFMGDDPNAALKNLPADMVDKVQVYDKSSDQAQFTGFDDGQSKKTLNIVTKKQNVNGKFGKLYAGYGTDDRYTTGLTLNLFDNARRLTILGMSNNINLQNFSTSDLFGTMGGGSGRPQGMGRGGMGGSRGGGSASNFSVNQMNGLTNTNSFGTNYTDEWGKKIKVSGSYFFNVSDNSKIDTLSRNYFASADSNLYYNETNISSTRNINHRFNFRFEYQIDSMNALLIVPKFTSQYTDYSKLLDGRNFSSSGIAQSMTSTDNSSKNLGFTFSNGITYRHRFRKAGRTITYDVNGAYTTRTGNGAYYAFSQYATDTTVVDQHSNLDQISYTVATSLAWTEPAGTKGQFLFNYAPSMTKSSMDKKTNNFDLVGNEFSLLDTALTNNYENTYFTHKAGINFRYNGTKASIIVGNDFQLALLSGNEIFPSTTSVNKQFESILPSTTFNYKFSQGKNLKVVYRTSTVAPTVTQLQDVIDNSNPLLLKTGNPDLEQDYEHMFIVHYGKTNKEKATGFFAFFYAGLTSNYIANSTFIASTDTSVHGVFLNRGSQLTNYVNMSGYKNARGFLTYSFALTKIKCNLGINAAGGYSTTPALINGIANSTNNITIGPGLTLSSNISEKLDFSLAYNGTYNLVSNSVQKQSDYNYFSHTASFKFNWIFYKGFVLNTSLDQTFYSGLGQGFNTNYLLWNASLGYKFLKDKSLEAKISAFDVLKQNTSVARNVTETYIEDTKSNVLQQYFMVTVTYNLKKFKTPPTANPQGENSPPPPPPAPK